ncbi:sodium:proton exchanger [candidate division WOR_3 bacterium SM23_60]|uniref:Sodium:proton exchanger n=1 Tax=candidate division WOR_3 bacterium SM23_60 TaxID=1703780 RepID=A0A0S8GC63_UNCW3|nr:MAG: sodium:proton exchanger [candidate division WOR_3 bacterium SM23_60]
MLGPTLLFIYGIVLLILSAHLLVRGASSLAKYLSMSDIAIGLTVVAFGTSAPELVVNTISSYEGHSSIVFGNVIGSNIFNTLLILGIAGLVYPLSVQRNTVWKEIPVALFGTVILAALVNDTCLLGLPRNALSLLDGIILLTLFVIFLIYVFGISRIKSQNKAEVKAYSLSQSIICVILGLTGLFLGGRVTVMSAVSLARSLYVSETLISITIVAAATSLPELATSVVAAYHKQNDIAVGNIVGSNVFNIFFILGVSSLIRPNLYSAAFNLDLIVLFLGTLALFVAMFTGKSRRLDRWESGIFIIVYILYLLHLLH